MGILDNLFKSIDRTLQDIEDGAIERRLDEISQAVDKKLSIAPQKIEEAANSPDKVIHAIEGKAETIKAATENVKAHASKTMEIIKRKD